MAQPEPRGKCPQWCVLERLQAAPKPIAQQTTAAQALKDAYTDADADADTGDGTMLKVPGASTIASRALACEQPTARPAGDGDGDDFISHKRLGWRLFTASYLAACLVGALAYRHMAEQDVGTQLQALAVNTSLVLCGIIFRCERKVRSGKQWALVLICCFCGFCTGLVAALLETANWAALAHGPGFACVLAVTAFLEMCTVAEARARYDAMCRACGLLVCAWWILAGLLTAYQFPPLARHLAGIALHGTVATTLLVSCARSLRHWLFHNSMTWMFSDEQPHLWRFGAARWDDSVSAATVVWFDYFSIWAFVLFVPVLVILLCAR